MNCTIKLGTGYLRPQGIYMILEYKWLISRYCVNNYNYTIYTLQLIFQYYIIYKYLFSITTDASELLFSSSDDSSDSPPK